MSHFAHSNIITRTYLYVGIFLNGSRTMKIQVVDNVTEHIKNGVCKKKNK